MTFVLQVPETEELIDAVPKRRSLSDTFCFGVTKEAIYLATRKKGFVLREPFETTRIPLSSVRGVALYPARAARVYIVLYSFLAFLPAALVLTEFMREGKLSVIRLFLVAAYMYSLACIVLGPRGRYRLRIDTWPQTINLESQQESIISTKAKAAALEVQMRFLDACRRAGLLVFDSRANPTSDHLPTAPAGQR